MTTLQKGYRGLELLVQINLDRFAVALALATALGVAAWLATP
jgi:hypothetical protein